MEQEIIRPQGEPHGGGQAFSPFGCSLAAAGVTLLAFCKLGAAMVATVWAASKLVGLPDFIMYSLIALGIVPVLWATAWTGARAWHVEQRLARNLDIDTPVFRLGHYFKRG
jgi:hypothetical protein